ncbi:hypothetical protein [Bradyrhizobium diazoefficiens]
MGTTEDKPKFNYRATPQLSANQMAEYLSPSTSSTRRTGIIRDARFPKTSIVAQYARGREGLVNFLGDGTRSYGHLAEATVALEKREAKPGASTWMKRDSRGSIEAIEAFQRHYNKFGFSKLDCRPVHGRQPLLDLWPTRISVSLDFTIHRSTTGGNNAVGGAVLLFSKGETSTNARVERSKIIAGLIHTYTGRFLGGVGDPDPALCLAVDVFGGIAHKPPGSFVKKLRNVADACDEIAARWRTVRPPSGYDGPEPD